MNNFLNEFRNNGVIRLQNVIQVDKIKNLQLELWEQILLKFGIDITEPKTWRVNKKSHRLNGMSSIMDTLNSQGKFKQVQSEIIGQISEVFGAGEWEPLNKWYSLLSFPGENLKWSMPSNSWHNDLPVVASDPSPWCIFAFVFLDNVDISNGPTLTVTGTHRSAEFLAQQLGTNDKNLITGFRDVNKNIIEENETLKMLPVGSLMGELVDRDEWFESLGKQNRVEKDESFFREHESIYMKIKHKVEPITGSVGDIVLLDPRCLHSFSENVSSSPRQVLRLDFRRIKRR